MNPYYHNGKVATENLEGCDSRIVMDRAIPFIRTAVAAKTPFLAVIWFHAPHEPVVAGPEFLAMYPGRAAGEQNYYGVITALDVQMGRLRKELRDLGVAENTMLWFASDNGPEGDTGDRGTTRGSAGPFRGRKRSLWEGGIHVPGPARMARADQARHDRRPLQHARLFPDHARGPRLPDERAARADRRRQPRPAV